VIRSNCRVFNENLPPDYHGRDHKLALFRK
jgi:hypothetical protein